MYCNNFKHESNLNVNNNHTTQAGVVSAEQNGINYINACDAIKDMKRSEDKSYRIQAQKLLKSLGYHYTFNNENEAAAMMIALVSSYYDSQNASYKYALVSLGLMNGFTRTLTISERREKCGNMMHVNAEVIRKKEEKIFENIIFAMKEDIPDIGVDEFVGRLLELAKKDNILIISDDNHSRIRLPSMECQNIV